MKKKTLRDLPDLQGKRVLVRVDFNVPQDKSGKISNDRRIQAALPTLRYILDAGASAIVMSHLGRPKGDPFHDFIYKMDAVGERLQQLLQRPVTKVDEIVGPKVVEAARALKPGEVLLLENLRFNPGEQAGDHDFACQLASLADVYVNDAFGTCHRSDASMVAVPQEITGKPRVVGFLVAKELEVLGELLSAPARPLLGILGGAKVSDKINFIKAMLQRVDKLLIGGAMTYTFLKAQGHGIGMSRCEKDKLDVARELLELGQGKIVLPADHLVSDSPEPHARVKMYDEIPDHMMGMDIGPKTIKIYTAEIGKAATVVWNGPMGKFEDEAFSQGTRALAEALAASKGTTIVGGGETAEAVEKYGLADRMTHVSTGGGAFLEFVEGTPFPALEQIDDA
jgi:phosphoglycerate kinase